MEKLQLAIVMPAYNEAGCIEQVATQWLQVAENHYGVLIVVNDGSKDETGPILDRLAARSSGLRVIHQKNAGHGAAVRHGYEKALETGAEFIFQTDSDDQFSPQDFGKLWEMRNESPFQLGVRAERHDPLVRIIISRINAMLLLVLYGTEIRDANVPFRLIRSAFLKVLLPWIPTNAFAPNIFLSVLAKRAGAEIIETPVTHRERETGTVSILRWKLLKVCLRCVRELWDFRFQLNRDRKAFGDATREAARTLHAA